MEGLVSQQMFCEELLPPRGKANRAHSFDSPKRQKLLDDSPGRSPLADYKQILGILIRRIDEEDERMPFLTQSLSN